MHPLLVSAYDKFEAARKVFSQELDAVNSKAQEEELAKTEKSEGKKYHYWVLATSSSAKKLADITSEESFEVATAEAAYTEFEKNFKELETAIKAGGQGMPINAEIILSPLNDFLIAAKERIRFVRDGKKYTETDMRRMSMNDTHVEGSHVAVTARYNDFIQRLNMVR